MWSPKSRANKSERKRQGPRRHLNTKFYTSKAWRETRAAYINAYRHRMIGLVKTGYWITRNGDRLPLTFSQVTKLLSLDYLPCEICLKLYAAGVYETLDEGVELDHIEPVNPENALISEGYGNPFDHNNLQLLCKRHHARKSNREK